MDAHHLIALLGQDTGTPLTLNEAGTLALSFDNGLTLNLEHDPGLDVLHCYLVLGQAPAAPDARQALFHRMLCANAFGRETGAAALGLDEITHDVILSQQVPLAQADVAGLRAVLEALVATAQRWQDTTPATSTPAPASEPPLMPNFDMRA